jgi:D-alanyl-D-alanine carboxypeptidase
MVVGLAAATPAAADKVDRPTDLPARAWVVVDAADGKVLAAHRANTESAIASTTKLMTAYVSRNDLRLNATVTAVPYDAFRRRSLRET